MNLTESLVLLAVSVGLLIFGRGHNGDGLSFFRRLPWVVGQLAHEARSEKIQYRRSE
jgi:hypothetical protein